MPAKIELTEKQIEIVKKMALEGRTRSDIAKAIGRNRSVVKRIMEEFDIQLTKTSTNKKGKVFVWCDELDDKLKSYYDSKEYNLIDIANLFGTSVKTVSNRAKVLRILKVKPNLITKGDIEYFRNNYGKKSFDEMCKERRLTMYGLSKKLNELGYNVDSIKYANRRMPEDDEFWDDYCDPRMSSTMLGYKYNIDHKTVAKWRKQDFGGSFKTKLDRFRSMSVPEAKCSKILKDLDIAYFFQEEIEDYRIDFYLGFKTIIEINGRYFHSKEKTRLRDQEKNNNLKALGYSIITIWDDEIDDIKYVKKTIIENYKKACKHKLLPSLDEAIEI